MRLGPGLGLGFGLLGAPSALKTRPVTPPHAHGDSPTWFGFGLGFGLGLGLGLGLAPRPRRFAHHASARLCGQPRRAALAAGGIALQRVDVHVCGGGVGEGQRLERRLVRARARAGG